MRERKKIRLKGYDYSQSGYYFVTLCTEDRDEWFGKVENGEMVLNQYGKIVNQCRDDLPSHYLNCSSDTFVVMPNHIHGIIVIHNDNGLSERVRGFKTFSSRKINDGIKGFQRISIWNITHIGKRFTIGVGAQMVKQKPSNA